MNKKRINICNIIESIGRGGAECLVLRALKRLDKQRFDPTVIYLSGGAELKNEFEAVGIAVTCLGLKDVYDWQDGVRKLYKIIRREKYDIIHTHLYFANIYGRIAARMAGVSNVITTLHNPDYSYEDNGSLAYKFRKYLDKYSGKFCNRRFLAVSEFVKDDFSKHLGFKNIDVLYNSIETTLYTRFDGSSRKEKRSELGFSDNDTVILNIGRLHPQKGQIYLLEAFGIIHKSDPRYKLIIIGQGAMEAELRQKAVNAGIEKSVIFLKERKDIPEILHASDIFVLPSIYEGFGIVLVEAMATGLPVVVSDIDTMREIVQDGVDGVLVEKANPGKLASAIAGLIQNPQAMEALGNKARGKAVRNFDLSSYVGKLENIYSSIAKEA